MRKILFTIFILFKTCLSAQCGEEITVEICDITLINNGVVNLYDLYKTKTGNEVKKGIWNEINLNYSLIDNVEGQVNVWNLANSTLENKNIYKYELFNKDCKNDVALTLNLKIGAFSGEGKDVSDSYNYRVCYTKEQQFCRKKLSIDLRKALKANPGAHKNGEWKYIGQEGTKGNYLGFDEDNKSFFYATVPYEEGGSLIEEETFEFEYTVNSDLDCNKNSVTKVKVAVVRAISAGFGTFKIICEDDLKYSNEYDKDINLRDDKYLVHEDIEGQWEHVKSNQASINIKKLYNDLVAKTPRFRNKSYKYTYNVSERAYLCGDDSTDIEFVIVEELKPFGVIKGKEKLKFCSNSDEIKKINLYENLQFTEENGVLYNYDKILNENYWSVTPEFKGKILNEFMLKNPDWVIMEIGNNSNNKKLVSYDPKTNIDLSFLSVNELQNYKFTYNVLPTYNYEMPINLKMEEFGCPFKFYAEGCNEAISASIEVEIQPSFYTGENTSLEICEGVFNPTVNLNDLLKKDPNKLFNNSGKWTDLETKTNISNLFNFPSFNGESKTFKLEYKTTKNACKSKNSKVLILKIHKNNAGGTGKILSICPSESSFNLFSKLDNASTNGTWTDPDLNVTSTNELIINPKTMKPGFYVYKTPDIIDEKGILLCEGKICVITLSVIDSYAGEDTSGITFCESYLTENIVDLFDLIKNNTQRKITKGGKWVDLATNKIINNYFTFKPFTEDEKIFNLKYTTPKNNGCNDTVLLNFKIYKEPNAGEGHNKKICRNGKNIKLSDLLDGNPTSNGFWTLPNKSIKNNDFILNPSTAQEGDYTYTAKAITDDKGTVQCEKKESVLTISISSTYAGENTSSLNFCEDDLKEGLDLSKLLKKDKNKKFEKGGVWTNTKTNSRVNQIFTTNITKDTEFSFEYTVSKNGCQNSSKLNFRVFKKQNSGEELVLRLCNTDDTVKNLFDQLEGTPSKNGIWIKPDGTKTKDENFNIQGNIVKEGKYIYQIPPVNVLGKTICPKQETVVTIKIQEVPNAGDDTSNEVCINNGIIDLSTLLMNHNTTVGRFYNSENIEIPREFNPVNLNKNKIFTFKTKNGICKEDEAFITLIPKSSPSAIAKDQEFCPNKRTPRISDLIVSGSKNYQWFDSNTSNEELPMDTKLKDGTAYFVENIDLDTNCKSSRTKITVRFTPIGEKDCAPCIKDGLTDNNDGVNDTLELCNLPELFPKYTFDVYNRFGVKVFKGNNSTGLFSGKSNIPGLMGGGNLPTGVYFYIFNPNDNKTKPIQSDFYIGR